MTALQCAALTVLIMVAAVWLGVRIAAKRAKRERDALIRQAERDAAVLLGKDPP